MICHFTKENTEKGVADAKQIHEQEQKEENLPFYHAECYKKYYKHQSRYFNKRCQPFEENKVRICHQPHYTIAWVEEYILMQTE